MPRPLRVLVAEDDPDLRSAILEVLGGDGVEAFGLPDGKDVRAYIDDSVYFGVPHPRVHALVTDLSMPGMTGQELLEYLDEVGRALPTIVVTGLGDDAAQRAGSLPTVRAVLRKPFEEETLRRLVRAALGVPPSPSDEGEP